MKKVSIIIPHFNSHMYVDETLGSINAQTYKNVEVIVVDDGSTQESITALNTIVSAHSNLDIQVFLQEKNVGPADSRNFGFSKSTGEYIIFLDADDLLCGKFSIEYRVHFLEKNSDYTAVMGYSQKIDKDGKIISPAGKENDLYVQSVFQPEKLLQFYCEYLLKRSQEWAVVLFLIGGNCFIRREAVLPFNRDFNGEEDIEWTLRMLQSGKMKLEMIPFYLRRVHDGQLHLRTKKEVFDHIREKSMQILEGFRA